VPETAEIKELAFEGERHSAAVESLRTIRTNIKLTFPDENLRTLLITSSVSREGKTTVSSNIAVSFSSAGKKVLLVDTDMRKPRVHKLFGVDNSIGISNYMIGEKSLKDVIRKNVYKYLDILMCGPIPPNSGEMIISNKFKDMLEELKKMYDIVIFDSPPVLAVSDSSILSTMIDGVIVVVKVKEVARDALGRTVKQLTNANVNLVGAVINNVDIKSGNNYGTYYYYYHNKYYGEEETEKKT